MAMSHEEVVRIAEEMEAEWKCQHCRHEMISTRRRLQNDVLRVDTDDRICAHIPSDKLRRLSL